MAFSTMFQSTKHEYSCVDADENPLADQGLPIPSIQKHQRRSTLGGATCYCILISSLLLNIVLAFRPRSIRGSTDDCSSPFAGLRYDTTHTFTYYDDYWGENQSLSDELWNSIDTNPVVVALSEEYIAEHSLPPSIKFPWDDSKSIYYLKTYHLLHCLKHMHKAFTEYERFNTTSIQLGHVYHCLDAFRQNLECAADDTPMPAVLEDHSLGHNQVLQCRSMDKLKEWVYEGDRNACFRMVDEYKPVKHALEKYAFCEKDSPYYQNMVDYFEKNGHQEMFKDEGRTET